jgi:peptide/nickel transport system permease protein
MPHDRSQTQRQTIQPPEGGSVEAPQVSPLQITWRLFRKNRLAVAGLAIFTVFFIVAVAGVLLTTGKQPVLDPSLVRLQEKLRPPLSQPHMQALKPGEVPKLGIYLLGTDDLGRDVFARMLQGAWVSLTVGFVAVGIAVIIGVFMGGIAGYFGSHSIRIGHVLGWVLLAWGVVSHFTGGALTAAVALALAAGVLAGCRYAGRPKTGLGRILAFLTVPVISMDGMITGLIDIMLCFPSFFLVLTVVALMPSSIYNIMAVIGFTSWMGAARFVRADFLSLREQDFVKAARALGVSDWRIIFRHMVPNAIAPVLVSATIGIATAILTEAGLSFLGFGVPPPHATWGNILSDGKNFLFDAPWLTFAPGLAILVVVLAFNLFGEGLRDALNPKLRS